MRFKVGDRVRLNSRWAEILSSFTTTHSRSPGDLGTILVIVDHSYLVKMDKDDTLVKWTRAVLSLLAPLELLAEAAK